MTNAIATEPDCRERAEAGAPEPGTAGWHPRRANAGEWLQTETCAGVPPSVPRIRGSRSRVLQRNMIESESACNHHLAAVEPESEMCQ